MNVAETIEALKALTQLEIDSAYAYDKAAERVGDTGTAELFLRFRDEHQRQIANLSMIISDLGGEAPEFSLDFRGFATPGYADPGTANGKVETLEAMRANELIGLQIYERFGPALAALPADSKSLLRLNYETEETHLDAIERELTVGRV